MVIDSSADLMQTSFLEEPFAIGINKRLQAESFDKGGEGVAYHDIDIVNNGNDYRINEGVDIRKTSDVRGNYDLGWLRNGEWTEYTTDVTGGTYDIKFRVAPQSNSSGSLNVKLDDELLGKVTITGTNGLQKWQTITLEDVQLTGGEDKILRLEVNNGGKFDLNWLEFEPSSLISSTSEAVAVSSNNKTTTNKVKARSADAFIDSIGVVAQVGFNNTSYSKFNSVVKPKLKELGIKHIRTQAAPDETKTIGKLKELAGLGIEFNFVMDPRKLDLSESVELAKMFGGSVQSVEGPNEWNHNLNKTYKGQSFPQGLKNYQSDLYQAIKSNPNTANIPVIAPSLSNAFGIKSAVEKLGKVDADINNAHNYPAGQLPTNSNFYHQLPHYKKVAGANKPLISTETGYTNALNYSGGVSEEAAATYLPRLLMEYFNHGFQRTYIYELMDDFVSNSKEYNYGLLRADGSKKPVFKAVDNLIEILDNSDVSNTSAKVPLGSLNFNLKGNTANIHQTLLQKKDGKFYLALWQEVSSYNLGSKSNINVPQRSLELVFNTGIKQAAIYKPNLQANAVSTANNPKKLSVGVTDEVTIVELKPS